MDAIIENFFNVDVARTSIPLLWVGVIALIKLVVVSGVCALVVGVVLLRISLSPRAWVSKSQEWFVDTVRALPPLVLLVVVYYLTPPIGTYSLDAFQAAVIVFAVIQGAYVAEILRGGLAAVSQGQYEAGSALGLTPTKVARFVIAPQVLRVVIPPMTSQATMLVRDASLTFFIGYGEVVVRAHQAVTLTSNSTPYTMALGIYFVVLLVLQYISRRLEKRQGSGRKSVNVTATIGAPV